VSGGRGGDFEWGTAERAEAAERTENQELTDEAAMLIIADVAIGPTILFGGLALGLVLFIPIMIVEALALWSLKWGSFGRALLDALIANAVSTIFGLVFFTVFFTASFQCQRIPTADGQHSVQSCDWTISPVLWFIAMAVLSILIEGGVLLLLKRHPPHKTWPSAVAVNLASYALLGLLVLVGALAWP
jgi:hypothetical protein